VDEAVIKYYRRLLKTDFENSGSIEDASIFVEAIGERMIHCGNTGNYMQLYINVAGHRIDDMKYLCSCEPTANVAVEILCTLAKGKKLEEAVGISAESIYRIAGSSSEELKVKAQGLLELLKAGIAGYRNSKQQKFYATIE
jgi:NifU-like protein involved in Fe-S cluster formation